MRYIILVIVLFGVADVFFSSIMIASPASIMQQKTTVINRTENASITEEIIRCPDSCDDTDPCTIDSCESGACVSKFIVCAGSTAMCPDSFVATCGNTCTNGKCSNCVPSCKGHEVKQLMATPTPCKAEWQCTVWDNCVNEKQTRTCTDVSACGTSDKPPETQNCTSLNHIIFSEVLYDTPGIESDEEWLKLYNPSNGDVDMTNWSITDNSGTWKFTGTINSKSYMTIARNAEGFKNLTGCNANIAGFSRGLNNDGDQLTLKNSNNDEIDFVAWEQGANHSYPSWNITASGGKSIKRISMAVDTDSVSDWSIAEAKPC